ncbi:serine/threonine-protein kinase PLK4-like [Galendromus occidentalis]|uniref:Serine/threonine-protein kinase PLK4 n=1 Tax=Galendromus occidentalis TaxID=34638 RepID=A0AAJ6QN63_9ACAR|nr:serine/threonine-protein kinase PLK4-like [Galendromus occidentalis]
MIDLTKELGQRIEDYEITKLLGRGGFAHVYHGTCRKTGVDVAIKMIDKEQMRAAGLTSRVQQEVSIHCRLRHPSIVELLTFFEDDANVYLIVEFCHGGEVQKYLETRETLSETEARHFLVQVAHGMQYLQSHNILHRDLSLSNLLLTQDLQVKISDFGLATQLRYPSEKHTTMCGTPNYIPPEIAARSGHGLEVDLWSLGCMLYTFLTGSPPFHDPKIRSTLTKVVMSSIQIPSNLSAEARDLIGKLLQKDPRQRIRLSEVLSHPFMCRSVSLLNRARLPVPSKASNSAYGPKPSEPLNTTRLKATRIKSGKMMLSILDTGEVVVEFLKGEMINSVLRVSSDGQWIVVYQPRIAWHPTQAAGLPLDGTDDRFSFESLPKMLWKKYAIASRFVHLVRQKTVKIILYQGDSACFLMENGDVEIKDAGIAGTPKKIVRQKDGTIKLNNQVVSPSSIDAKDWQFLQTVALKLSALEESICAVDPSPEMFPAIFGRRTTTNGDTSTRSNLTLNTNFTSLVDRSPESVQSSKLVKAREVHVDGLGVARRLPSGEIIIEFYDRTKVAIEAPMAGRASEFCFVNRNGVKTSYPEGSSIPIHVRQRLGHLPRVIDLLK